MNTGTLMIGDWARLAIPDQYSGALCTIKSLYEHNKEDGAYISVFVQDRKCGFTSHEAFNEDLRPIPLTEQFFNQNGFRIGNIHFLYSDKISHSYTLDTGRVVLTIEDVGVMLQLDVKVMGSSIISHLPIKYIHELQHIMRNEYIDLSDKANKLNTIGL